MTSLIRTQVSVSDLQCRDWIKTLIPSVSIFTTPRRPLSSLNAAMGNMAPLIRMDLIRLEKRTRSRPLEVLPSSISQISLNTRVSGRRWVTRSTRKTLSATAHGFEDRLRENGVLLHGDPLIRPPSNLVQLNQRLRCSNPGPPTATNKLWSIFKDLATEASNERDIGMAVERHLFQDRMNPGDLSKGHRAHLDKQWLDYPMNQGFNDGLSDPRPDYTEGYKRSMFPPTLGSLGGAVTLNNKAPNFIALPHFAAEYKARGSDIHSAKVQAGYVGAAMSNARSVALQSLGSSDPPRHAGIITAVTDGMIWQTYAHYQDTDEETGNKVYHCQYLVASGFLHNYEGFQEGFHILRNAQGFAQEQSSKIRDRLWQKYACLSYSASRPCMSWKWARWAYVS